MKKNIIPSIIYSVFGGILIIFVFIALSLIIKAEVSKWKSNKNCTLIDLQITQTISNLTDIVIDYDRHLNVLRNRTRFANTESWSILEIYSLDECNITILNRYIRSSEIPELGANLSCYQLDKNNGCHLILGTSPKTYGIIIFAVILVAMILSIIGYVEHFLIKELIFLYKNPTDEENSSEMNLVELISSSDN